MGVLGLTTPQPQPHMGVLGLTTTTTTTTHGCLGLTTTTTTTTHGCQGLTTTTTTTTHEAVKVQHMLCFSICATYVLTTLVGAVENVTPCYAPLPRVVGCVK